MGRQVLKRAVAVALILGLFGCASYPPPIILPDKATNFTYQYSVDIPGGWDAYEKFPKDIDFYMPQSFKKLVTLVLVNKDSKGIIVIANEKTGNSFQEVLDTPDSKWHEIPPMMEKEIRKNSDVSRYDSKVKIENLAVTHRNYMANNRSFKSKELFQIEVDLDLTMDDSTIGFDWFVYPCHRRNFCQTIVMLASEKDKIENNRPAFDSVVQSLTMHDIANE